MNEPLSVIVYGAPEQDDRSLETRNSGGKLRGRNPREKKMKRFLSAILALLLMFVAMLPAALYAEEDMTLSVDVLVVAAAPLDNIAMSLELMPLLRMYESRWESEQTAGATAGASDLVTDPGVRMPQPKQRGFNILKMPTARSTGT